MSYPIQQTYTGSAELAPEPFYERAPQTGTRTLAKALGWFSIGLGVTELMWPRQLGRAIGVGSDHSTLLPLLGLREITSGLAILTQSDPTTAVRSRVAGDVMDLALLGATLMNGSETPRVAAATAAVLGVTALDVLCATELAKAPIAEDRPDGTVHVTKSISINRSPAELYAYWRKLENLPQVLRHLQQVREGDGKRSHWVAQGAANKRFEWEAELTTERPNELLAWQSVDSPDLPTQGYVDFKPLPAGRGAIVTVHVQYAPPAGKLGAKVARLFRRAPEQEIEADLRRWKQLIEAGEVATTAGQPSGKRSFISRRLP